MLYYLPWINQPNRIYTCKLSEHIGLNKIREWAILHSYSNYTCLRYDILPADISRIYYTIATDKNIIKMFQDNFGKNYYIDIINDINKICIIDSSVNNIFNIDNAYYLFPFMTDYCIIIGLDDNYNIVTKYTDMPLYNIVKKWEVFAFDYNNQSKCIYNNSNNLQVILKIHYCIYHKRIYYFRKIIYMLSKYYNNTKIIPIIEYYIGFNNISFLFLLFYIAKMMHYNIFLFGCLAIYYLRKMNKITDNCNICIRKRDLRFYYTIYSLQIYYKNIFNSYLTNIIFFTFLYFDLKYLHSIFE